MNYTPNLNAPNIVELAFIAPILLFRPVSTLAGGVLLSGYQQPFAVDSPIAEGVVYGEPLQPTVVVFQGSQIDVAETSELEHEFQKRLKEWKKDIRGVSSLSAIVMHPAYQRIMAMGEPALPMILSDLRDNSGHWFYALRYIAGEDKAAGTKTMSDAKAAWLEWGYKNGHI
jgi:hypothetical protein